MIYPGNEMLGENVRQRILTTYEQTLALAAKGSTQEALLGCDFILRMDPDFEVAQVLQDRLRAADGPIQVDDLSPQALASAVLATPAQEGVLDLDDLDDGDDSDELDSALPDFSDLEKTNPQVVEADALEAAFQELLDKRELQRLVRIADDHKQEIATNPAVRKLVTTAYTRLEAEPYVNEFLSGARQAIQDGHAEQARSLLEKARSLDPSHPGIEEVGRIRSSFEQMPKVPKTPPAPVAPQAAAAPEESFGTLLLPQQDISKQVVMPPQSSPPQFSPPKDARSIADEPLLASPAIPTLEYDFDPPAPAGGPRLDPPPPLVRDVDSDGDSPRSDDRIGQLLAEGQEAFDKGSYQSAIDSWSRIFLIDIDHDEAARRIDLARQHKAEDERRVEELFSEAINAYDAGSHEIAREGFERVLALNPGHVAAREYLEQIERPDEGLQERPASATVSGFPGFDDDGDDPLLAPLPGAVMVPPDGDTAAASVTASPTLGTQIAVRSGSRALRRFWMLGLPVLLLLGAAGWYVWQHRAELFPNSTAAELPEVSVVDRARKLHEDGKTVLALRLLRGISAVEPDYDEAQALIAEIQTGVLPAVEEPAAGENNDDEAARLALAESQESLLSSAREAMAAGENLLATERFQQAQRLGELPAEANGELAEATRRLESLQRQVEFFRQGEWEVALPTLWRLHEEDPANRDVVRLMVDSYYNLALRDLQRGDAALAAKKLEEALGLRPGDETLQRHLLFARSYAERQKDLQYWIYAKYLPSR
jgi:tetratricopeptide (TPR) repeat protein